MEPVNKKLVCERVGKGWRWGWKVGNWEEEMRRDVHSVVDGDGS